VGALFAIGVIAVVLRTTWGVAAREAFLTTATTIGGALVDKYVLPFEVAGVLLTVALIGAVVLVRED
jgi:NADH-quinone oxidoreductase subunit J